MYDVEEKWIFTHPQKTAGTSIESILGCFRKEETRKKTQEKRKHFLYIKHLYLTDKIQIIENEGYDPNDFFKFVTVRNPWDRMVSWYYHQKYAAREHWDRTKGNEPYPDYIMTAINNEFKDWIKKRIFPHVSYEVFTHHNGVFFVDYVIKFENIENDAKFVFDKLGIDTPLIHFKQKGWNRPDKHYSEHYDTESRDIIAKTFKSDIERYEYTYD